MRRGWMILVACAMAGIARADDAAPVTDPAAVRQHYREVVARPEFRESAETMADVRWTDWIAQWLKHLVSRFQDFRYAGQLSGTARAAVIVLTALTVTGLVLLLLRLTRRRRERAAAQEEIEPGPGRTLLSPRHYERRLRTALESRDWHDAWLAAWLQFLARLENRHLVEADRSRTNREYLAQLRGQSLPSGALPLLAGMVDDYDRVIYGRRPVDEAGWTAFRDRIDELTLQLGLRERATEEPA
jgi:hypothetical protein